MRRMILWLLVALIGGICAGCRGEEEPPANQPKNVRPQLPKPPDQAQQKK
jgi:hypothetical protein